MKILSIYLKPWRNDMHKEVLTHLEFWKQFCHYLEEQKPEIRLGKPANRSSSDVILRRRDYRLRARRLLKDDRLDVSVHFNGAGRQSVAQQQRHRIDERLSPLGSIDWRPDSISMSRPVAPKP